MPIEDRIFFCDPGIDNVEWKYYVWYAHGFYGFWQIDR